MSNSLNRRYICLCQVSTRKLLETQKWTSSAALPLLGTLPSLGVSLCFPYFLTFCQLPLIKLTSPLPTPTGVWSFFSVLLVWNKKSPLQVEVGSPLSVHYHKHPGWELSLLLKNCNTLMPGTWIPYGPLGTAALMSVWPHPLALAAIISYV